MFLQKNILNAISYVKPKFTGAGFSLFIFFTVFFIAADFDLYGVSKDLNNPYLWSIFYGYGIICSIFIDLLAVKIPKITGTIKIAFYVLAGYLIFLPFGWMMVIVGGTVGALCSLVFYFGTYMARKNVFFKYIFAICAPFILCIILNTDFTVKKDWREWKRNSSYIALFDYFHGEHAIPIYAEKGQTITFSVKIQNNNGGGHGFHVLNKDGDVVAMKEVDESTYQIKAAEKSIYHIIVTGDKLKGSFTVTWDVNE
ncbi:hypothetical protein FB379_12753 [Aeribacillus composti]|nr:hypothetical protein FB379_12753 [Aeribacillus composti]